MGVVVSKVVDSSQQNGMRSDDRRTGHPRGTLERSCSLRRHHPRLSRPRSEGRGFALPQGDAMWMADLKHGEHVGELPAYAAAFKEVYRFILEALGGDDVAAIRLFRK